jgi:transposase
MRTINLSTSETDMLNYERYHYPDPVIQKRLHAVYLKAKLGRPNKEISHIVDASRNSISNWLDIYESDGFEGLCKLGYGTNTSELQQHATSILDSFKTAPPMNSAEAVCRIEELTGIKRGVTQVIKFMKRQGFRYRKMGHIPAKADQEKQRKWMGETMEPVIEAALKGECHLFYSDAAHFILGAFICSVWSVVRMFIQSGAGRNRINVLGAVHAVSKEMTTLINTTYINADTVVDFLHQLKTKYTDLPIFIVMDNARYQHCILVKETAEALGITLLFLPPYSPNLNVIERLWKFTKKKVLYGKYYDSPAKFHQAIITFFQTTINQTYKDDLKSLLSLKFQFFDTDNALNYAA